MVVHNDILYVGGPFFGSDTSGFAAFDLKNGSRLMTPSIKSKSNGKIRLHVLKSFFL